MINTKNGKMKREHKIIMVGFFLAIITLSTTLYLIIILGRSLNRFLWMDDKGQSTEIKDFNFEAYEKLNL